MKKIINSFCLLLLFCACQKEKMFFTEELPNDAVSLLDLAIEEEAVIGIAAGYAKNDTVWDYSAGFSNEDTQEAFSTTTLTRLASIAKPMTAIAILQLLEKGKLNLDSPIQEYLSDFPIKPEGDITIRHLLNHSSGIAAYKNEEEIENQVEYESIEAALAIFKDRELIATPGTAFNYTTYGYVVLGRIIEVVSGQNYETYMQENIWDIVGMTNTKVERTNESYDNKSELYQRNDKGEIKLATANNLSDRIPGGGIISTLEDLMKFGNGLLNNDFISKESLDLMLEIPDVENSGIPYGLGLYLYDTIPDYGAVYGHGGGQTGASTIFMVSPEQNFFIVVLTNTSLASDEVAKIISKLYEIAGG